MKFNNIIKCLLTLSIIFCAPLSFASVTTEAQVQYNNGIDFYKAGQFEESARCFQRAIDLNPNYIDAYYNYGSIMEYLHNDELALMAFKQIILRKPDDYESVYKAAEISHRLGQDDKAKMYLTLIPTDTLIGQKAKQLNEQLSSSDLPVVQEEYSSCTNYPENADASNASSTSIGVQSAPVEKTAETEPESFVYENISSPTGIVKDSKDNIYVADFADNLIYKIGQDNNKIVFIKNSKIDGPIGMAIDRFDNIYIANYNKDNVVKVDNTGATSVFVSNISKPYCMYVNGNYLYISSQGNNAVVRQKLAD